MDDGFTPGHYKVVSVVDDVSITVDDNATSTETGVDIRTSPKAPVLNKSIFILVFYDVFLYLLDIGCCSTNFCDDYSCHIGC